MKNCRLTPPRRKTVLNNDPQQRPAAGNGTNAQPLRACCFSPVRAHEPRTVNWPSAPPAPPAAAAAAASALRAASAMACALGSLGRSPARRYTASSSAMLAVQSAASSSSSREQAASSLGGKGERCGVGGVGVTAERQSNDRKQSACRQRGVWGGLSVGWGRHEGAST